jgi:hypothetical protein
MDSIESRIRDIKDGQATPDVAWLCATVGELLMREERAFDAGLEVGAVLCEARGYVDTAGEIRSVGSGAPS